MNPSMSSSMGTVAPALRILPEILMTLTGVLVMLVEAVLKPKTSRKPLGIVAILGTLAAIAASVYQLSIPAGTAFFGTVQSDAFSVFFHLVIGGIVLVTLLISLDYFEGHTSYVGEYYALILFGATGMMLMTCSVELLMVFISLEISSIATYILAGYRKRSATSPEASIKYFLLGSFATAFFLYGIALCFGATGSTNLYEIAKGTAGGASPLLLTIAFGMMLVGLGFKVSLAPFHVWTPDVYEGAPTPVVGLMSTAPKAAAFAVLLRITYGAFGTATHVWMPMVWILAVLVDDNWQPGRADAAQCQAHTGLLLDCPRWISAGGLYRAGSHGHCRCQLLHCRLCRHERRRIRHHRLSFRLQRIQDRSQRFCGCGATSSRRGRRLRRVFDFADRHSLHGRLLRKILCIHCRRQLW